jgi:sugar phosphate permease
MKIETGASPRFFYGWWIVLAGFIVVAYGTGASSYITRMDFLFREMGGDAGEIAVALSIFSIGMTVASLVSGPFIDRYGPRKFMLLGIPLAGMALLGMSFEDSLRNIFLGVFGIGMGAGFLLPVQTATANWFKKSRSIALAVICAAPAIGGWMLKPVGARITSQFSPQSTLLFLGAALLIIGIPLALVIRHKPERKGKASDGEVSTAVETDQAVNKDTDSDEMDYSLRQAIKTKVFWILAVAVSLANASRMLAESSRSQFLLERGFENRIITDLSGLAPLMGLVWILLFGFLGDRFSKRYLLAIAAVIQSLSVLLLMSAESMPHVYLYLLVYGFGSAIVPLMLAIRADYFGPRAFATITVVMGIFSSILAAGPVLLSQAILGFQGNHRIAFLISMSMGLMAAVVFLYAKTTVSALRKSSGQTVS